MDLTTIDGLIKYHRMMEARARTTSSMIMHFDAAQTLERIAKAEVNQNKVNP
jgi:hypothetical protein